MPIKQPNSFTDIARDDQGLPVSHNNVTYYNGADPKIAQTTNNYVDTLTLKNIQDFETLCKQSRPLNNQDPYEDPFSQTVVPQQWNFNRKEKYKFLINPCDVKYWGKGPAGTYWGTYSDQDIAEWLDVPAVINCYIYYTDKLTNIFLPGYGWRGTTAFGGHRCDNAEFDIYVKIWNKYFKSGGVNMNNFDPLDTKNSIVGRYIQNPTPYDRFMHIPINIDGDYMKAFLENRFKCNGAIAQNNGGGLIMNVGGHLRFIAKSDTQHAPHLVVFVTIGSGTKEKYIASWGQNPFIPECNSFSEPIIPGRNDIIPLNSSFLTKFNKKLATPKPLKLPKGTIIGPNPRGGGSRCAYENYEAHESCRPIMSASTSTCSYQWGINDEP